MTTETEAQAYRLVGLAVSALLRAAELGNPRARHLYLIATGARSPGRPPHDDAADLAAIESGEPLADVAARRAAATGQTYEAVRRRLKNKRTGRRLLAEQR
jgi:hypothetical protein